MFRDNLFASSHLTRFSSSLFITSLISAIFSPVKNKLLSSANNIKNADFVDAGMSLIYNRNNRGPNMDPWGTPHLILE